MVILSEIRVGSVVVVRPGFGVDEPVNVKVAYVNSNIKNGRPGIDYKNPQGGMSWAYLSQVDNVVKY